MRTLTSNELHRLRHIVAEQANDAQAGDVYGTDAFYLSLNRMDAADVADALEELVSLREQEEDAARHEAEKAAIIDTRKEEARAEVTKMVEACENLAGALDRLFEAVEG